MSNGRLIRRIMQICGKDAALRLAQRLNIIDGGPGSGNFGHKGRPGKVGGSGEGGGKAFRTTTSEGSYVGVQKAAAFRGIKKVAHKSKDASEFIHSLSKEQRDMISQQYRQSGTKERIMDYTERLRQLMTAQKPEKTVPYRVVEGNDISGSASWDGIAYTDPTYGQTIDTEIEHVIVQQGFNGPPKVVSEKELLDQIAQHPEMPVLFRSYAALGEEAVQAYDDMLENGEWYVDCSNGGAQYGQGMYCAGVYGSDDYSGALSEMQHYRQVSMKNALARWVPALAEGEDCFGQDGKQIVYRPDQMTKTEENEPPEAKDVIAMLKNQWTTETVKGYFMPADPEDDESPLEFTYYTDTGGWQTVPAEKVPYWGPIDRIEKPPAPAASTRMMTLDPSAKIIAYNDLLQEMQKRTEAIRSEFFEDEIANEMAMNGYEPSYEVIRYLSFQSGHGYVPWEEAENAYKSFSDKEKEAVQAMTLLVRNEDNDSPHARAIERTRKIVRGWPADYGALAASWGYDAINAQGHGATNSYTVVLNRTKLILSQSRIDVA